MALVSKDNDQADVYDPQRWGLPVEAIVHLRHSLRSFWWRFRDSFKTKTTDSSEHALTYLRGLLSMDTKRNYANIAPRVQDPEADGQKLKQFMSDSPWSAQEPIQKVQREIASTPSLSTGGVLILDESANKKAGPKSAGAGRQHNGRLGKLELSRHLLGLLQRACVDLGGWGAFHP